MAAPPIPTISRVLPDGTAIELVYNATTSSTALAQAGVGIDPSLHDRIELPSGEVLTPYSADNPLIATGCVLLPSEIVAPGPKAALVADIKAYLHRFIDLSPLFEEIAAHYVLLSWVSDAFNDMPILRLRGEYGSGKTRGLLAIGALCHKVFFASGASTVSPVFHILDAFQGTLALDEADFRLSDATTDLVKILNNGTTCGLPVLRTMTNRHRELHPTAFRVFGPKIIAMRGHFTDDALESRMITEEMGVRPLRKDIELSTPASLAAEALTLRNRMLAWRFAARHEAGVKGDCVVPALSARGNQMALPLLSLVDERAVRDAIGEHLVAAERRARARCTSQTEATLVGILDRLSAAGRGTNIPLARIAAEFNAEEMVEMPVKSVGHVIRKRLGLQTRKSTGVYVIPAEERPKIAELVARYRPAEVALPAAVGFGAREARVN